jgi:hypothetical protein
MPPRLYFDLAEVAKEARQALMADGNERCPAAAGDGCEPALWLFRQIEIVWLRSNGTPRGNFELRPTLGAEAQPRNAVTVPAFQAPPRKDPIVLPLLNDGGPQLADLIFTGHILGYEVAMYDPGTGTLGVGRRRLRAAHPRTASQALAADPWTAHQTSPSPRRPHERGGRTRATGAPAADSVTGIQRSTR